jgi:hypothetical protein
MVNYGKASILLQYLEPFSFYVFPKSELGFVILL